MCYVLCIATCAAGLKFTFAGLVIPATALIEAAIYLKPLAALGQAAEGNTQYQPEDAYLPFAAHLICPCWRRRNGGPALAIGF
jgi:hypothetical protein